MDPTLFPEPPAIVHQHQVDDLYELAATINAEHLAGEQSSRRGLEHFRAAGEALLKAKAACGHGKWLDWLKTNVRCSSRSAQAYMSVAQDWSKCTAAAHLADALRLLTDEPKELATLPVEFSEDSLLESIPVGISELRESAVDCPTLSPGHRYECAGTHRKFGPAIAEFAEHPEHAGYWTWSFVCTGQDEADVAFAEYQGRGCKMEQVVTPAKIMHKHEFTPDPSGWHEMIVEPDYVPLAVAFDRQDRDEGRGRWAWTRATHEV